MFALYAAPAINLFEKSTDRVPVNSNQHEYHVVPDRSRNLDFEPHRILERLRPLSAAAPTRCPRPPLYSAEGETSGRRRSIYTVRRMPRRRTAREKQIWGLVGLYRHGHVHLSCSSPRRRRTTSASPSSASGALLQSAPDRATAGRRRRRRFSSHRQYGARSSLRRRADAAARAGRRAIAQPQPRPPIRQGHLAAHQSC